MDLRRAMLNEKNEKNYYLLKRDRDYNHVKLEGKDFLNALVSYTYKVDVEHIRCKSSNTMLKNSDIFKKDEDGSKSARLGGKYLFRNGEYYEALKMFTSAVNSASEKLSLGKSLIKRSTLSFHLGLYSECLIDIELAKYAQIPINKLNDVKLMQEKAKELVSKQVPYQLGNPSVRPKNPDVYCAFDNVIVSTNKEKRIRQIVARRDIEAGELIAVEEPLIGVSHGNNLIHCDHCFRIIITGYPCANCTRVQYCSLDCLDVAYRAYHKEECKIIDMLQPYEFYGLVTRMVLAIRYHLDTFEKNDVGKFLESWYKEFLQLDSGEADLSSEEKQQLAQYAAQIFEVISKHTNFIIKNTAEDEQEAILKGLIMKLMLLKRKYFKTQNRTMVRNDNSLFDSDMCYPFHCLFQHSCAPNVIVAQSGPYKVSRALVHINQGEELFISHGPCFWVVEPDERHEQLGFQCKCQACEGKWPPFDKLNLACDEDLHAELNNVLERILTIQGSDRGSQRQCLRSLKLQMNIMKIMQRPEYPQYVRAVYQCMQWLHCEENPLERFVKAAEHGFKDWSKETKD